MKKHVKVVQMATPGEAGAGAVDRWRDIGTRYRPERKYTTESDWKKRSSFLLFFVSKNK